MSGALAVPAMKMIGGAVVGKLVGKVTGNEKLGMIAGLTSGFMIPGGAAASAVGGKLKAGAKILEANPVVSQIGAGMVGGAANAYMENKMLDKQVAAEEKAAALSREQEVAMQNMKNEEAARSYNRTHQQLPAGYSVGGGVASPAMARVGMAPPSGEASAPRPMTAPEQYFQKYNNMYAGRVR